MSKPRTKPEKLIKNGRARLSPLTPKIAGGLPNWEMWRYIPRAMLWEGVALSCSIDPEVLRNNHRQFELNDSDQSRPPEFARRLKIALAHLGEGWPFHLRAFASPMHINTVILADFAAMAEKFEWELPEEFPRDIAAGSETIGANQGAPANPCAVFLAMKNLTADEVSIAFVGDKNESGMGANNMLEISARDKTRRVPLAALDLVDRRKVNGELNSQGVILLGMTRTIKLTYTTSSKAKMMSRLRKVFSTHLGISVDPFNPYRPGAGWEPRFKIDDKRGAADERAKREAERRTDSYEQLSEHGAPFSDVNQTRPSFYPENDAAGNWLKNNDSNESV